MTISATKFFSTDYVDYASYDNLRKIASVVDGQKNSSRKVLYTILEKNINSEIKVQQLGSKVAEFSEYLHGSLDGVIVNLAQNFPGTNNIPLLTREGNFGTRFTQEAAAPRYIYTFGTPEFFKLFLREDSPVLMNQTFEGHKIEPRFYVPELPMLLVNGSEGVSSGFAQKILPRKPSNLKRAIQDHLNGKKIAASLLVPFFAGFNGTIQQGDSESQWLIKGTIERLGRNKILITEVPIGYDLRGYLDVLDTLEEKKIIQSYVDKSEDDNFKFEVNIPTKVVMESTDDELLQLLKLVRKVTENYTVMDENNRVVCYESVMGVLDHYIRVKLEYLEKRKAHQINSLMSDIDIATSKWNFINRVVNDVLVISRRKKADVVADIEKYDDIIPSNGSYDYLLNMNIMSMTEERMKQLEDSIKVSQKSLETLKSASINDIWLENVKIF